MKAIIEKQGRCIGGKTNIKVGLYDVGGGNCSIRVLTGVRTFSKMIMCLELTKTTLNNAKAKYYEVLAPLEELWEINENADND